MPAEQNRTGRRPHYHRGRRGPDRRGGDRRSGTPIAPEPPAREQVDVEEIMADIRARVSQRPGVELTSQQVQELAARRLETILDPRGLKPALLEQLRRAASSVDLPAADPGPPAYVFEDTTLYTSHRGLMRFIRRLLNPVLKLFFNPGPLIQALHIQSRLNTEAVAREAERERQQAEWNALHYELLQRLATEISRLTIEAQSMSTRVESLAAKVDFNERRVRGVEQLLHQARTPSRSETATPTASPVPDRPAAETQAVDAPGDLPRRKRRRRRGRRSGAPGVEGAFAPAAVEAGSDVDVDATEQDEAPEGEDTGIEAMTTEGERITPPPPAGGFVGGTTLPEQSPPSPDLSEHAQPTPPRDEPEPGSPVDHPDPGPPDR